jgi:hypothetical protein
MGGPLLWVVFQKLAQNLGTTFPQRAGNVFILTKNGLRYILGDLFTNESGHSGRVSSKTHSTLTAHDWRIQQLCFHFETPF